MMSATHTVTDSELRVSGIEALNRALGATGALRFLGMIHRDPTDYVEVSRRIYDGQTVEAIFERAKVQWTKPS
jgi:hypothetical protein